jgi:hypothetical protein
MFRIGYFDGVEFTDTHHVDRAELNLLDTYKTNMRHQRTA